MWEDIGVLAGADHFHGGHRAASLQVAKVEAPAGSGREGERVMCGLRCILRELQESY